MTAHHQSLNVFHGDLQFVGDKASKARRIQNARHTDNLVCGKSGLLLHIVNHRVERVRNHNDKRVRGIFLDSFGNRLDNSAVLFQKIVTAHTRHPRETGSHNNDIRALDCRIVRRTLQIHRRTDNGTAFLNIESLSFRHSLSHRDVNKNNVAQLFLSQNESHCSANLTGTHEGDFFSSHITFLFKAKF